VLLYQEPLSETARARLKVIYEQADGFAIAEADLRLRGPGEFLGERQSGEEPLRFADLVEDEALVVAARAAAEALLDAGEDFARRHVDRWLGARADYTKV
jgi:ATP-dependent DNA helicase RecG